MLAGYATRIAAAPTEGDRLRLQKEAARKWLRATNVLRPPGGGDWPRTLDAHAAQCLRQHPDQAARVAFFLAEAQSPSASGAAFTQRLVRAAAWLSACVDEQVGGLTLR